MNVTQLTTQLIIEGGAIVLSSACNEMEIADAQATNRFAGDIDGFGYVRRTKEWLELQVAREKICPNTGANIKNRIVELEDALASIYHSTSCTDAQYSLIEGLLPKKTAWPECTGDPDCCPENAGYGCCKSQQNAGHLARKPAPQDSDT